MRTGLRGSWLALWLVGLGACSTIGPGDVPEPSSLPVESAVARDFPGARAILAGFDASGEPEVRDGDRALFGIELALGDTVERRLLAVRAELGHPRLYGAIRYSENDEQVGPVRMARPVHLQLTLYDTDGRELQRSRTPESNSFVLGESFVAGIAAARRQDEVEHRMAVARLVEIVNLLQQDAILRDLLAAAAEVPWDPRLLLRRELRLEARFATATATAWPPGDARQDLRAPHELAFDLLLNDSVFIRAATTVVAPHGPTAAFGGIASLRAQQATDARRQVRLQLLATARGEASDWQRHGMLAALGAKDRGVGLAFSPDGRWVATPGALGCVELRDLSLADPSPPRLLVGAALPIADLAFVDATTLLVARGATVEVHDVGAPGAPVRVEATASPVVALEAIDGSRCFVGMRGAAVQRCSGGRSRQVPRRSARRCARPNA